jgi:hypothetical protein
MTTKTDTESFWAFPATSTRAAHYFRGESEKSACGRRTGMTYDSADVVAEGALTWTSLCAKCEAAYDADKAAVVIASGDVVAFPDSRNVYVVEAIDTDGIADTVGPGGLRRSGPVSALRFIAHAPKPVDSRADEIAAARAADERIAAAWSTYWEKHDLYVVPANQEVVSRRRYLNDRFRLDHEKLAAEARVESAEARLRAALNTVAPYRDAAEALDEELYTGWTRFYLVKHIHNSKHCSSFRLGTRIGWLPNLSGLTEAEAVAEHGAILCTKCFPSAPVEYTDGRRAVADDTCPGSGTPVSMAPSSRRGFAAGNWAECPECGKKVGMPGSAPNVRKHKRP